MTMMTVGYGDYQPISGGGYFVACLCSVTGIIIIALPTPIIVNNFTRLYNTFQTCERLANRKRIDLNSANGDSAANKLDDNAINLHKLSDNKGNSILKEKEHRDPINFTNDNNGNWTEKKAIFALSVQSGLGVGLHSDKKGKVQNEKMAESNHQQVSGNKPNAAKVSDTQKHGTLTSVHI